MNFIILQIIKSIRLLLGILLKSKIVIEIPTPRLLIILRCNIIKSAVPYNIVQLRYDNIIADFAFLNVIL